MKSGPGIGSAPLDDFTTLTIDDGVAVVTMDDGKANALGHEMIGALLGRLDEVANPVPTPWWWLVARGGSGPGFDLSV
ncbi:MAG: hypothetical protein Ct9H300mP12_13080 [Acidimicrobiales bacterium]|nr:MAG: hypothetical protein Ct9H300mP12_13080 [Acidimicrobiales bacterium]